MNLENDNNNNNTQTPNMGQNKALKLTTPVLSELLLLNRKKQCRLTYLEKTDKIWRKHLRDGGEFALSDLVPFVSVGGKRLGSRGADNSQSQSKDVRLPQVTVGLQRKSDQYGEILTHPSLLLDKSSVTVYK